MPVSFSSLCKEILSSKLVKSGIYTDAFGKALCILDEIRKEIVLMSSLHGVSFLSACEIIATFGSLKQYSAKELSALSGLAPYIKESGSSVHSSYMSRKSSGRVRQILYLDSIAQPYFQLSLRNKEINEPGHYFNHPFYLVLNLSVGGFFPDMPAEEKYPLLITADDPSFQRVTALPADGTPVKMYVDYIRVYKQRNNK